MKLIDADALEAKLEEQRKLYIDMDMKGAEHLLVHDVLHHVWEAPAIDAVPATIEGALGYLHSVGWIQEHDRTMTEDVVQVIRCKDCKYYDTPKNFKKPYCMRGAYVKVNADDYCSKGGRR